MNRSPSDHEHATALPLDAIAGQARHFLSNDRIDLAEGLLRDGLARSPQNAELIALLGRCALARKRFDEAERLAHDAAALAPESLEILLLLGDICQTQGKNRAAESHYLNGLRRSSTNVPLLYAYARLLLHVNELDKAERVIRECLRLDPELAPAQSLLSLILGQREHHAGAAAAGEEGLRLAPGEDFSHVAVGLAYFQRGRPFLARRHLREALRQDPGNSHIVETFEEVDLLTRWIMLPYYYFSLLVRKLPGANFGLWALFIVAITVLRNSNIPTEIVTGVALCWLLFAIYTWIARPLGGLWVKVRPAR